MIEGIITQFIDKEKISVGLRSGNVITGKITLYNAIDNKYIYITTDFKDCNFNYRVLVDIYDIEYINETINKD
jgi:hypothetical protein